MLNHIHAKRNHASNTLQLLNGLDFLSVVAIELSVV